MEFIIKNLSKGINDIMRTIGYQPAYFQPGPASTEGSGETREFSIVRQLTRNDYPRFHLYIKKIDSTINQSMVLNFSLHLDQKKPSYEGAKGHSGEYDGEIVEGEAKRIKQLLL